MLNCSLKYRKNKLELAWNKINIISNNLLVLVL